MCEVRVIQTLQQFYCFDKRHHFTEKKRETKETQAALRSSVKLERAKYTKQMFVTLQNDNTRERLLEPQQKRTYRIHTYAKIKERKERYVFTISPAFSVYLADDESHYFRASQRSFGHQIPPVGHSGGV